MSIESDIAEQVARVATVVGSAALVTAEPREAAGADGVAVLVEPPTRDYTRVLQTWQLTVCKNTTDVGLATTKAFSAVIALLEASDIPIEEARPASRRLSPEKAPVPAYLLRYTSP